VAVAQFGKTNQGEQFVDPRVHLGRAAGRPAPSEADVAGHGARLQQVEVLEHHADALALLLQCPGGRVVRSTPQPARCPVGPFQQVDAADQRALAGAGAADDAEDLAGLHVEGHLVRASVAAEAPRRLA
jgi:hypothetical protein